MRLGWIPIGNALAAGCTWRAQLVSLHGLLDYDESDTEEATMELSLAAEALQDMLSRDYGTTILSALVRERCRPPPDAP